MQPSNHFWRHYHCQTGYPDLPKRFNIAQNSPNTLTLVCFHIFIIITLILDDGNNCCEIVSTQLFKIAEQLLQTP